MIETSRRGILKSLLVTAAGAPFAASITNAETKSLLENNLTTENKSAKENNSTPTWGKTVEGQRKADLGNGTYLNPIISGDHPDPTILKDGEDYYVTFSSFYSYPGLIIWHSRDLVNWSPVGPSLFKPLGTIWAVDLCKHNGRYFIYIPAAPDGNTWSIYAIWADNINGPWSDPIDLKISGCIDPGHAVGEDGKRYLFVNGVRKIRLSDDGLSTDGSIEPAYSPWRYPEEWIVENFAPEGPKLFRRNEYFYLVTAVGGTAGPATGHMVIAARSKSIHGPWEHCPHNPIVRTTNVKEPWWSRGHASLVEGPHVNGDEGDWWMVYHAYENGFRTLGRQLLLEPVQWTSDGWFHAMGGDLSQPLPKPITKQKAGEISAAGFARSDDFKKNKFGTQWCFHDPAPDEMQRVKREANGLRISAKGLSPSNSSPLTCGVGDRSYEAEISLELTGDTEAGLLLFYNHKAYVGLGFNAKEIKTYEYSEEQTWMKKNISTNKVRFKLTNDNHVVTYRYSFDDGKTWQLHGLRMEVSGIHHNVFGGFLSLKVGIYCAGNGSVLLRNFTYKAI